MLRFSIAYFATGLFLVFFDFICLRGFYFPGGVRALLMTTPVVAAAVMYYLICTFALVGLAVMPALQVGTLSSVVLYGAAFGFFYSIVLFRILILSNNRTEWSWLIFFIDAIWGTGMCTFSVVFGFYIARMMASH